MELGNFSISLAVKDIEASKLFYEAQPLKIFTDIRELQRQLKASGVNMIAEADESSTGPASFMIADPDGNTILVDQHV
jgi:predicted enzyme related to lactoylglutathione lyase